jgi:hypothetical protein
MFTARYALSPYIKQIRFVFKGLNVCRVESLQLEFRSLEVPFLPSRCAVVKVVSTVVKISVKVRI